MWKFLKYLLIILIVVLIILRLCLPHILLQYVIRQIDKIPDYRTEIADLNMNLWRGSYTLVNIQLWKKSTHLPVPYYEAQSMDFSIHWEALLHGKLVAKIMIDHPTLNFVTAPDKRNEQLSINDRWIDIIKSLFPLNINRLEADDGEVYFRSYNGHPPFTTYIKNIHFILENMQNASRLHDTLPSAFLFTGNPMGGGDMKVDGRYNPFVKIPTFHLKGELISLQITQIAKLLKHYTDLDVTSGTFSLYGEFAAAHGVIKGYAKPFFKNLKIGDAKKESPIGVIYNGLAAVAAKILENPKKKTVATQINLEGQISDPDTSILSIIGYMLHHAFIQALIPGLDNNIQVQDVFYGKKVPQKSNPKAKYASYRNS